MCSSSPRSPKSGCPARTGRAHIAVADVIGRLGEKSGVADQIRSAALAGENKIDESISAMENAHKAAPDQVGPVVALVAGYIKQGKPDKAMALCRK